MWMSFQRIREAGFDTKSRRVVQCLLAEKDLHLDLATEIMQHDLVWRRQAGQ